MQKLLNSATVVLDNSFFGAMTCLQGKLFQSEFRFPSTAWIKLEQFNGEQVARFFQVITFPQRELCARYSMMNSN